MKNFEMWSRNTVQFHLENGERQNWDGKFGPDCRRPQV